MMETFERMQKDVIALLWNSHGNFIEKLLPIDIFQQQIDKIRINLSNDLQLPDIDPIVIGQLATITNRVTNATILFHIKIPLISKVKMTAFILHPYPTWHDGFFVSINARFKYLLINQEKTMYYTMTEAQFFKCKKANNLWLCIQDGPLYNIATATKCEMTLLIQNKFSKNCEVKIAPIREFWQQLYSSPYWIYSLYEETVIRVECGLTKTTQQINGQGALQIQNGCTLRTKEFSYTAYDKFISDTNIIWPAINISSELPNIQHLDVQGKIEIFKMPEIPKPNTLPFNLPVNWKIDIHDIWHYGLNFTNLLIVIAAMVVISIILRRLCSATRNVVPIGGFRFDM